MRADATPWTAEEEAQMRALYESEGPAGMSLRLGRTELSIQGKAQRMGLRNDRVKPLHHKLAPIIRQHAGTAEGFSVKGHLSTKEEQDFAGHMTSNWCRDGILFRGKLSHKRVRYFTTQAAADAYVERNKPREYRRERYVPTWKAGKAWWDPAAPVHYPDGYKHTVIPPAPRALRTNTYGELG